MVYDLINDRNPLDLTKALVSINSTDPGNYEAEIFEFLKNTIDKYFDDTNARDYASLDFVEALPGRSCIKATIHGTDPAAPALVYMCHMDTVTDGAGWSEDTPAFTPVVRDGKLYGRGSCDMKGGLACALLAWSETLAHVAEKGGRPDRDFSLILTCDEEADMHGSEAAIAAGWVKQADWVLDTEPTDGLIRVAHKGRTWFDVVFDGVTAHASTPEQGADAICAIAWFITDLKTRVDALPAHADLGKTTVTFGMISGGYQPYVVPDRAEVTIDMRLVPPVTPDDAVAMVDAAIEAAEKRVAGSKGSYAITGNRPAIDRDPDSPLVAALETATEQATGTPAGIDVFTGYTDTAVVAGTLGNRTTASYGPGNLFMAHKPDEYVCISDLDRVYTVLVYLAENTLF
jgi:succinyl-diaminopimelate desuccinylase